MEETMILRHTAKLAGDKGFEYYILGNITQSLLQKWYREKHGVHINVFFEDVGRWTGKYTARISSNKNNTVHGTIGYDTYEYALEDGLQKAAYVI